MVESRTDTEFCFGRCFCSVGPYLAPCGCRAADLIATRLLNLRNRKALADNPLADDERVRDPANEEPIEDGAEDGDAEASTDEVDANHPISYIDIDIEDPTHGDLTFDARAAGNPELVEDGKLVLLLHGFPQTSLSWEPIMGAVASEGHYVVAFDQRGYSPGARPPEVSDYALDNLVDDVFAVADSLGAEEFSVAGHDWGAVVAWAVAGRESAQQLDRVASLTAVSVGHPTAFTAAIDDGETDQADRSGYIAVFQQEGSEDTFLANDAAFLRSIFGDAVPPQVVEGYVETLSDPGAMKAAINWYRAIGFDSTAVGVIDVPTLMVWSTGDGALGREQAEGSAEFVSAAFEFVELDRVSHWIPDEAAADLATTMIEHLDHI